MNKESMKVCLLVQWKFVYYFNEQRVNERGSCLIANKTWNKRKSSRGNFYVMKIYL